MGDILGTISTRWTPQSEKARVDQVPNAAGGHAFAIDDEARLRRFLVLGTQGGTYYTSARELTISNVTVLERMAKGDSRRAVDIVVDISTRGAAPKQNPALFALAYLSAHGDTAYALSKLQQVARTGTHLFQFVGYVQQFRGWGRGLRRAVAGWYTDKNPDDLAYQVVKYRQRNDWTHKDLLRLSHPYPDEAVFASILEWIVKGTVNEDTPALIHAFIMAQEEESKNLPLLIRGPGLTWEMLPSAALNRPDVWEALLDRGMPQTALMRQLPRLTRLGLLQPGGWRTQKVAEQLTDPQRLKKARVHPMNVLIAQRTYAGGKSLRGSSEWVPTREIVDALDAAFYAAYGAVEPAGKRTLIGLDVSGSMSYGNIGDLPLTPRDASAALSLVTMATEPQTTVMGFSHKFVPLSISPRQRLEDAIRTVTNLPFGGTDCALPMLWAMNHKVEVDTFLVVTDNETWAGRVHPFQALEQYRQQTGIPARLIVAGMTATDISIADPNDSGSMDVAGFDTAVPQLVADFSAGRI